MANEKKTIVNEATGEVTEIPVSNALPAGSVPAMADLDSVFNVVSMDDVSDEAVTTDSEWKFPGLRVTRSQFKYKEKTMFSYAVNMNLPLSTGGVHALKCELRSSDRKNIHNYEKLDAIWAMLPKDQTYLLLGFQYVEYTRSYNLCVQVVDDGIPLRVSLLPRDGKSRDDLGTMIAFLQKRGLL